MNPLLWARQYVTISYRIAIMKGRGVLVCLFIYLCNLHFVLTATDLCDPKTGQQGTPVCSRVGLLRRNYLWSTCLSADFLSTISGGARSCPSGDQFCMYKCTDEIKDALLDIGKRLKSFIP